MNKTEIRKGTELVRLIHTTPCDNLLTDGLINDLMQFGKTDEDEVSLNKRQVALILNTMLKIVAPPKKTDTFQWLSRSVAKNDNRQSLNYLCLRDGVWYSSNGHILNMAADDGTHDAGLYKPVSRRNATPAKTAHKNNYPCSADLLGSLKIPKWNEVDLNQQEYRSNCRNKGADRQDSVLIGDFWYRIKYIRIAQSHQTTRDPDSVMYVQSEDGALMINTSQRKDVFDHNDLKHKSIVMPMWI